MIIVVTIKKICIGDFIKRLEEIAGARPDAILLREKSLSAAEYKPAGKKNQTAGKEG